MKKDTTPKKVQKLQIHRETLRNLRTGELKAVAGGISDECSMRCSSQYTCRR